MGVSAIIPMALASLRPPNTREYLLAGQKIGRCLSFGNPPRGKETARAFGVHATI
jgi:hypothetical protein